MLRICLPVEVLLAGSFSSGLAFTSGDPLAIVVSVAEQRGVFDRRLLPQKKTSILFKINYQYSSTSVSLNLGII